MEYQEFNNIKFYRSNDNDYFRHFENGKVLLMHRYVWEFYNCKIPKGYHIHHIDGDKSNNDISNLQLLKGTEHHKLHSRLLTDEEREWRRHNIIDNAVPKAIVWHKSKEGRDWHKQQYLATKYVFKQPQIECECLHCHKTFTGNNQSKFCSNTCKSAYRRSHNIYKVERTCVICGDIFLTDKYKKACCCSAKCRAIYGHQSRKGN